MGSPWLCTRLVRATKSTWVEVRCALIWCPGSRTRSLCLAGPFFLAANLFNSEGLMPHLMMTLLKLTAVLPPDSVYVSIYESNSKDETGLEPTSEG